MKKRNLKTLFLAVFFFCCLPNQFPNIHGSGILIIIEEVDMKPISVPPHISVQIINTLSTDCNLSFDDGLNESLLHIPPRSELLVGGFDSTVELSFIPLISTK